MVGSDRVVRRKHLERFNENSKEWMADRVAESLGEFRRRYLRPVRQTAERAGQGVRDLEGNVRELSRQNDDLRWQIDSQRKMIELLQKRLRKAESRWWVRAWDRVRGWFGVR